MCKRIIDVRLPVNYTGSPDITANCKHTSSNVDEPNLVMSNAAIGRVPLYIYIF